MNENEVLTVQVEELPERPKGILYTAVSSIGRRESQQDSLYIGEKEQQILAVVCDGMGGMNGGERASELAVQKLAEAFWSQDIVSVPEFYKNMAYQMDDAVYLLSEGGKLLGAGTTIVSILIRDGKMYWLSVGDSKIYIYRRGQMICPVVEHNYRMILNKLLASEKIDRTTYNSELPKAEALVSFLGLGGLKYIEINQNPFILEPGDQILLCSDGLYKSLDEEEILGVLDLRMSLDVKVKTLIDRALQCGGPKQDNTSIILIEI
jgi:protein phosphatase